MLIVPTDYAEGYEKARVIDPDMASNYIAHMLISDPPADAFVEELYSQRPKEINQTLRIAMDMDEGSLGDSPAYVRDFFDHASTPPDWLDPEAFLPGIRMFHRNSPVVLASMLAGTLVEGFSTNISKSFFITGRLRDQGVRRLKQNNRHMIECFMPGGLERTGDGWKLSVRVRIVHAQIRRLMNNSDDWDHDAWGVPVSSAHLGFAITAFSARLLRHMRNLGASYNEEERESFMVVWRYTGYLMGIPDTILFKDEEEAVRLFEIGGMCEPTPGIESVVMANALINSGPLLVGMNEPKIRRSFSRYVYRVSRALVGKPLSNELSYPATPVVGVLPWFRMQMRYKAFVRKYLSKVAKQTNFTAFTSLLEVSAFDEAGISYRLPDHVYAEQSSFW